MKEIDTVEIEKALQHEREIEPSKFDQVTEHNRYSFVVRDQLEVTPVIQQGFDSLGTYIDGDW
jgi:hypothetical protein